jgi:hypothetical protein
VKPSSLHLQIFERKFPDACDLEACQSGCCRHGAWIGLAERDRIQANAGRFRPHMRPEVADEAHWFGETRDDEDFPGGVAIETREIAGACVLFHPSHGCALQKAARDEGLHEWHYKPRYCVMFPLVVDRGMLRVDDSMKSLWCMQPHNGRRPILDAVEREVRHLFDDKTIEVLLGEGGKPAKT